VSGEFETSSDIDSGDLILTQQLSTPDTAEAENEYADTSDSVSYVSEGARSDPGTPVKKDRSSRCIRTPRRSDNVSY
jgi:hypothetical protein